MLYWRMLRKVLKKALNLLYPTDCATCGKTLEIRQIDGICVSCRKELQTITPPFCQTCGRGIPEGLKTCADCKHETFHFERAYACFEYKGKVKILLHTYKFKKRSHLKKVLGDTLSSFANKYVPLQNFDLIVPVPLNRSTLLKRGFNQSELLGKNLSNHSRIRFNSKVLKKTKPAHPQSLLTKLERKKNIQNAFLARPSKKIQNKNILLVDDILTTGQTASECARVLKKAGASRVSVLALARGVSS